MPIIEPVRDANAIRDCFIIIKENTIYFSETECIELIASGPTRFWLFRTDAFKNYYSLMNLQEEFAESMTPNAPKEFVEMVSQITKSEMQQHGLNPEDLLEKAADWDEIGGYQSDLYILKPFGFQGSYDPRDICNVIAEVRDRKLVVRKRQPNIHTHVLDLAVATYDEKQNFLRLLMEKCGSKAINFKKYPLLEKMLIDSRIKIL